MATTVQSHLQHNVKNPLRLAPEGNIFGGFMHHLRSLTTARHKKLIQHTRNCLQEMFPPALYVLEMAFLKRPLGKTFQDLFLLHNCRSHQIRPILWCVVYIQQKQQLPNADSEERLVPSELCFTANHTFPS